MDDTGTTMTQCRKRFFGLAPPGLVAIALLASGCEQTEVDLPASAITNLVDAQDPTTEVEGDCTGAEDPQGQTAAELQAKIDEALRVAGMHRNALAHLERDARWEIPEQVEPLKVAVNDTRRQITMKEQQAGEAQCALAQLP